MRRKMETPRIINQENHFSKKKSHRYSNEKTHRTHRISSPTPSSLQWMYPRTDDTAHPIPKRRKMAPSSLIGPRSKLV
jgi:hypothetical protein